MLLHRLTLPILMLLAPCLCAQGAGDLLVSPTRVVFEGRKRAAELNLSNVGSVRATYRINLVRMEMLENGGFRTLPTEKTPGQVAPEDLLRFSPREVTLEPGEAQTVRLQLRKPADLPAGEYRVHLSFQGVPPPPEPEDPKAPPVHGLSITLKPVFGLAIPVIIRSGETSATVALAELAYDPQRAELHSTLLRKGNQSVYGDFRITFKPASGPEAVCGEANGVAIYTPNPLRKMVLPVSPRAQGPGRLHLTYALPETEGGALLAEAFLDLP
jgi:hypothetical protein